MARSSTEVEYRALASMAAELIWIQLLSDFRIQINLPTLLLCDSSSAISFPHNLVFHLRIKHIDVDCHYIRDYIQTNLTHLQHIATNQQLGDLFTKPLPIVRFNSLSNKLIDDQHLVDHEQSI